MKWLIENRLTEARLIRTNIDENIELRWFITKVQNLGGLKSTKLIALKMEL